MPSQQTIALGDSITGDQARNIVRRLSSLFVVDAPEVKFDAGMEANYVAYCYPLTREIHFRTEYIPYVAPFHEFFHVLYTDYTGTASQVPSEAFAQYFGSMSLTQGQELLDFSCNDCRQSTLKMLDTGMMECLQCGALYAFDLFPKNGESIIPSGMQPPSHAMVVPLPNQGEWDSLPGPGFPHNVPGSYPDLTDPNKVYGEYDWTVSPRNTGFPDITVKGKVYGQFDWTVTPRNTGYPNITVPGKQYGQYDWTVNPRNTGFPNITVPGKVYGLEDAIGGLVVPLPGSDPDSYDEYDPNWKGFVPSHTLATEVVPIFGGDDGTYDEYNPNWRSPLGGRGRGRTIFDVNEGGVGGGSDSSYGGADSSATGGDTTSSDTTGGGVQSVPSSGGGDASAPSAGGDTTGAGADTSGGVVTSAAGAMVVNYLQIVPLPDADQYSLGCDTCGG